MENKKRIVSILLVLVLVATNMIVIFPLSVPKVRGQITHLASADLEDGVIPYDIDGVKNGIVVWDMIDDHIINMDYTIEPWMTLDIPALNYTGLPQPPPQCEITFTGFQRIDVLGELITNYDGDPFTKTAFIGSGFMGFDGIYFHNLSKGRFYDCLFKNSANGVYFMPDSTLTWPGVRDSEWDNPGNYGLRLEGAVGYTNMRNSFFDDTSLPTAILLEVSNGMLNISNTNFLSHGPNLPAVHISDATVTFDQGTFYNYYQPGNSIYIEGNSSDTVITGYDFREPALSNYYIRSEGSSYLSDNCSFRTEGVGFSILASDNSTGAPSHPIILNPTADGIPGFFDDTFDNSTMNATGSSSVSLQWYKNVYVIDPDGNPVPTNSPVRIKDRLGNPAQPPMKLTNATGWAIWFKCTELIVYASSVVNFNPFNVSAENNTVFGYAGSGEIMNMSKENTITVPFNPIPSQPSPSPPTGVQAQLVGSIIHVMISWNASADDGKGENDVVGYSVYKSSTGVNGTYGFAAWINATGSASYNWTDLNAGDGDWNDYFYLVRANDTLNTEEKNINKVGKFVNYFYNGWNLISVPLIQSSTSKEYVMNSLDTNYVTIQRYHAGKSRPWLHWHRWKPNYFNDPMDINHEEGYYIDMLSSDYLVVAGKVPTNSQISLKAGWNLIDYPCLINKTVNDALSSIAGKYNKVEFYDTVKDREVGLGLNDYMKPGFGYWIHATENCVWEI